MMMQKNSAAMGPVKSKITLSAPALRMDEKGFVISQKKSVFVRWQLKTFVVGLFSLVVSGIFLRGMYIVAEFLKEEYCLSLIDEKEGNSCQVNPGIQFLFKNVMALLVALNLAHIVSSILLIWGTVKKEAYYLTAWLNVSFSWTYTHAAMILVFVFATKVPACVFIITMLCLFLLGMNVFGISIVLSFHYVIQMSLSQDGRVRSHPLPV